MTGVRASVGGELVEPQTGDVPGDVGAELGSDFHRLDVGVGASRRRRGRPDRRGRGGGGGAAAVVNDHVKVAASALSARSLMRGSVPSPLTGAVYIVVLANAAVG